MRRVKLVLEDEVNVRFENLTDSDIDYLVANTELMVKGAYLTAAFKTHNWNGKESQFSRNGHTFYYMLDKIFSLLSLLGYNPDADIDIEDKRNTQLFKPKPIDKNFLSEYGEELRYYQVEAVNSIIEKTKGFIEAGTASGKTFIAAATTKAFDQTYRSIFITNNDNLANAALMAYENIGLNVALVNRKLNKVKKAKAFQDYRHIITTWQTLNHNREFLKGFNVIIYDEAHIMGDVMFNLLVKEAAHIPIRIGLTATLPRDKQKREKVCCRIGADIIYNIDYRRLADEGWVSEAEIKLVETIEEDDDIKRLQKSGMWDWDSEEQYMFNNRKRLKKIAAFIQQHAIENSLILCHPQAGAHLAQILNIPFIDGDVDPDIRRTHYEKFDKRKNMILCATYNTVGTGISIDDIFRMFIVDVGKDYTRVVQSIGRGVRLDTEKRNRLLVWDIFSDAPFSRKHQRERLKIYTNNRYYHYPTKELLKLT